LEQKHQAADESQGEGASGERADQAGRWIEEVSVKNRIREAGDLFSVDGYGERPVLAEVFSVIPDYPEVISPIEVESIVAVPQKT
jgi:hypothetical protein